MTENTINNEVTMSGAGATLLAGRYRVVKQLGQGGMGSVWLAEDTKLDGHPVAIKMLPSILVSNKRAYAQVKKEALVSLKLSHSNIAAVRAFEEEHGNPFLVMDYIDGQTLDDYLAEKGKLTEEETIRLLKPVAAALDYAHTQGIVHRDVKPGNIMIRKDGVPFVLDFGIAREIQETMTRVTGKLSSGTLMYMGPEQLNGDAPKPAQDVYSFAAMAYECLKGEPPFSRGQIEFQILNNAPAPLASDVAIGEAVLAGLAKSPEARPTTCAGVLATGSRTVGSRVPRDRTDAAASARRTRTPIVLGALALAALVGVGGWLWSSRETTTPAPRATQETPAAKTVPVASVEPVVKVEETPASAPTVSEVKVVPTVPQVPPPVDEVAERQRLNLAAETAAYELWAEMEDASQRIAGEPADVREFFDNEIREFEKDRKMGDAARTDKNYVMATNGFTRAKALADKLKRLVVQRDAWLKATERAEEAKGRADAVDAVTAFAMRYAEAKRASDESVSLAKRRDFAKATARANVARDMFVALHDDVVKAALDRAKRQKDDERWKECLATAEKILGWEADNAEALALKKEAENHLGMPKGSKAGEEREITLPGGEKMKMVWCPAGEFTMGSPNSEEGRDNDEAQHKVTLTKGFWMGKYEVTQAQWKSVMGTTVIDQARKALLDDTKYGGKAVREWLGKGKYDDPATVCGDVDGKVAMYYVSWEEANEFCEKVTAQERAAGRLPDGWRYCLPTEAQWEYACRARTTAALPNGKELHILGANNGPALDDIAWYGGNSSVGFLGRGWNTEGWKEKQYPGGNAGPRKCGLKEKNGFGLYDMIGNVWEWCSDWYGDYPTGGVMDPTGPASGTNRVNRGGSWCSLARHCRSAHRDRYGPGGRDYYLGFRLVCSAGPRR